MQTSDPQSGTDKPATPPKTATDNGHPTRQPPKASEPGMKILVVVILVGLIITGLVWRFGTGNAVRSVPAGGGGGGAGGRGGGRGDLTVPVTPGMVVRKTIPVYLDGLGTVQAFNTVTVKPRVDGQLINVAFTEGQDVTTNDLLAQIDPNPYQATLDQAKAKKLQDEAQLENAKVDLDRDILLTTNIVTEQALATQRAMVHQLEAAVTADQAGIEGAQVQLNYTTISAPIAGRCGLRLVDQGNIVHANDSNGLVVITQLRPISVVFTLPEQQANEVFQKLSQGKVKVLALGRDNKTTLDEGTLAVIDNQIDASTGTIKLKATFPNANLRLWPGQFVNPRVLVQETNGLIVPENVIQRGPDGEYVFVINDDNTVKLTPVKVARMQDDWALIASGLEEGQKVVVEGQYRLEDGSKIRIEDGKGGSGGRGGRRGGAAGGSTNQPPKAAGA